VRSKKTSKKCLFGKFEEENYEKTYFKHFPGVLYGGHGIALARFFPKHPLWGRQQ